MEVGRSDVDCGANATELATSPGLELDCPYGPPGLRLFGPFLKREMADGSGAGSVCTASTLCKRCALSMKNVDDFNIMKSGK